MPEKVGNFSRLTVYFRFERQIGHHLIQTFAPSSLVVMLSWFSFWLGLDAIPGRVTLLVTCMLTLVTMFTGADIPPVAYVKVGVSLLLEITNISFNFYGFMGTNSYLTDIPIIQFSSFKDFYIRINEDQKL